MLPSSTLHLVGAAALGAAAALALKSALEGRKKALAGKIRMGYWSIRGLGAPLRMMLEFAGAAYEDTRYADPKPWFEEKKPELLKKNALANLPYLEMPDGTVVSESNACFAHLAEALGLVPADEAGKLKNVELLALCMCTRNQMTDHCYHRKLCSTKADFDAAMGELLSTGNVFAKYEASLEQTRTRFFCGDAPCACDFHIFEMMDQWFRLAVELGSSPPLYEKPLCAAFYTRFRSLPPLRAYFASPAYGLPVNAPGVAHWG